MRGKPRSLLLCCPCGCGEIFPLNLDSRVGPAWRLWRNPGPTLTVFPSVWRESGCCSHFVIWHDNILLFDQYSASRDIELSRSELETNAREIMSRLRKNCFSSIECLSDDMNRDPWDVLSACKSLENIGEVVEGRGENKGRYRLR